MPNPLMIRPAEERDLEACATLLAGRIGRDSAIVPHVEPALSAPSATGALIQPLFRNARASGVVAEEAGRPVGFLFGERMLLSPTDMASLFIPHRSVVMPMEGHAVAGGCDPSVVYRAMYAELAAQWVADGFFVQRVAIAPGNAELQEAWVALGFGRQMTAATRATHPVEARQDAAGIEIERVSPEDIDDVIQLADELNKHHWQSPMFWPVLAETDPAAREFNLAQLRSNECPYFVAYQHGRPVGMQTFLKPGFTPPTVARERDVYLFEGVVSGEARSGGIGTSLLREAMDWARGEGLETCTLHFAPGNPTGGPFWLGHGFAPVEYTMERRIDERIAWARPRQ